MSATDAKLNEQASPTASYKMTIDGTEYTQNDPQGVIAIVVENHLDMIGQAKITLNAHGLNPSQFQKGKNIEIEFGGSEKKAFVGVITELRHTVERGTECFLLTALDPLTKLANTRATKVWGGSPSENIKDSDVANEVIAAGGAAPGTVDATTGGRPYVFQRAETNLAFLKRLAARNGYLLYAEEGKIQFKKPQFSDEPLPISQGDLVKNNVHQSDVQIPTKITVFGWNHLSKKQVKGSATPSDIDKIGSGSPPSPQTTDGEVDIVDVFVDSDSAAKEMAKAEMNRLARGLLKGTIEVHLNGKLVPGVKVKLEGQYTGSNPELVVVACTHVVEVGGASSTQIRVMGNTIPD